MNDTIRALSPLLMLIAIIMIVAGAALSLCFGYAAWQVLYHPEKVTTLSYILGDIAANTNTPALTATVDGRIAEYKLSAPMKTFGLAYLFIAGLSMLVSIARGMSDIGVHIIKALTPAQPAQQKKRPASAGTGPVNTPPAV